MPRFVILEHDHPTRHWDLMLEHDGVLKTWRLPQPPTERPDPRSDQPAGHDAVPIHDHRLHYLDYEGPLGGDRGHVKRWDAGTYELLTPDADAWAIHIQGTRWQGSIVLRRLGAAPADQASSQFN